MERYGTVKLMHSKVINAKPVESLVLPAALTVNGRTYPKGTWWVGFKIYDDDVWQMILEGKLKGFSIGGRAMRKKVRIKLRPSA